MNFASTIIGTAERVLLPDVPRGDPRLCSHAPDPDCASLHPGYRCKRCDGTRLTIE